MLNQNKAVKYGKNCRNQKLTIILPCSVSQVYTLHQHNIHLHSFALMSTDLFKQKPEARLDPNQ